MKTHPYSWIYLTNLFVKLNEGGIFSIIYGTSTRNHTGNMIDLFSTIFLKICPSVNKYPQNDPQFFGCENWSNKTQPLRFSPLRRSTLIFQNVWHHNEKGSFFEVPTAEFIHEKPFYSKYIVHSPGRMKVAHLHKNTPT